MVLDMAWGPANSPMLMSVTAPGGYVSASQEMDDWHTCIWHSLQAMQDSC